MIAAGAEFDLDRLKDCFDPKELEWRIAESGMKKNGDPFAKCFCYITNRGVENRLDDVVGAANWSNEYKAGPLGGVLCGISIRIGGEWVTKWDGADNTDFEPIKGGLSDSMKRSAVQWGIGRYLYDLETNWADCFKHRVEGSRYAKTKAGDEFYWTPPKLPDWAIPGKPVPEPSPKADPPKGGPKTGEKSGPSSDALDPVEGTEPGSEASRISKALSSIAAAMTAESLDTIEAGVKKRLKQKIFTSPEAAVCIRAIKERRAVIAKPVPGPITEEESSRLSVLASKLNRVMTPAGADDLMVWFEVDGPVSEAAKASAVGLIENAKKALKPAGAQKQGTLV